MLVNNRDWRSLAYLIVLPILVIYQWQNSFSIFLYIPTLLLAIGVSAINHNHGHIPLWKNHFFNKISDYWICLLQGCPVFLFEAAHIKSHHRYNQGPEDVTRVARVGSHNHLLGYIIFPVHVLSPISELKKEFLKKTRQENIWKYIGIIFQHILLISLWISVLYLNWQKALVYVIFPQFLAVHFLLASNYLQHAHAEAGSEFNHSRNFIGFMNTLYFNVGFHTAHHQMDRLHWTELPAAHASISKKIDSRLNEKSFVIYFVNTLTLQPLRKLRQK